MLLSSRPLHTNQTATTFVCVSISFYGTNSVRIPASLLVTPTDRPAWKSYATDTCPPQTTGYISVMTMMSDFCGCWRTLYICPYFFPAFMLLSDVTPARSIDRSIDQSIIGESYNDWHLAWNGGRMCRRWRNFPLDENRNKIKKTGGMMIDGPFLKKWYNSGWKYMIEIPLSCNTMQWPAIRGR